MVIMEGLALKLRGFDECLVLVYNGSTYFIPTSHPDYAQWKNGYNVLRNRTKSSRESLADAFIDTDFFKRLIGGDGADSGNENTTPPSASEILKGGLVKLIDFFKEFEFEPNFRFVNTLSFKAKDGQESALEYINNYFALMDNQYKSEIEKKTTSTEFKNILKILKDNAEPKSNINTRFAVYYGSAGTGKTTLAMKESDNRCVVCNASMLPSDLMEDFVFSNGEPTFQKSTLWNCMENGLPIVLDEINLLPFDSLRFLQGILDGKKEFDYKGHKVTINDGFKVIGTMNLSIGGMVYGLPEPLIDRCADMKEFKLSADQLLNAVI